MYMYIYVYMCIYLWECLHGIMGLLAPIEEVEDEEVLLFGKDDAVDVNVDEVDDAEDDEIDDAVEVIFVL